MKRWTLAMAAFCLCAGAKAAGQVNLDSLYRVLDQAIDSSAVYVRQKEENINALRKQFLASTDDEMRFQYANSLYKEYIAFENDSALAYIQICIDCAERMDRADLRAQSELALAYQLADTGFYTEAEIHFDNIPDDQLTGETLLTFLSGKNHLYGELGFYSHDKRLSQQFHERSWVLRDSLLRLYPEDSRAYAALKSMILNNQGQPDEALPYSDRWMSFVTEGTRSFAIMAFYRSEIFKSLGNGEMQRYWLVRSALTDVRAAIMDQAALWSLANALMVEEGDVERAYRYMDFSWSCISRFSTHMRSWLVSPILTLINDKYKERLHAANTRLQWAIAAFSILLLGLVLVLLFLSKKRKQLATARNELKQSNDRLSGVNSQLTALNAELSSVNSQLSDSNRVKDEYITKFLQMCSEYIDKLENFRLRVHRMVKTNQYANLAKLTGSEQMKEDELRELFDNFDAVFLHLFPNFVDEFNALLRPEDRIVPPDESHLNTDLRIFALVRLGIEESMKIAEFLRYSPNSIYAYRARIRNKAAGNREEFERRVKEIGLTH